MRKFEVVVPTVKNDGTELNYVLAFRDVLSNAGFTGWTEQASIGYWYGKMEPGIVFTFYSEDQNTLERLCNLARMVMHDQEAIQVTIGEGLTTLVEA